MPRSGYHRISRISRNSRISVLAVIAGSVISATAACGGSGGGGHAGGAPHANGTEGAGSGTHVTGSASPTKKSGAPAPVFTASVPTISDGTDKVVIGGVSVTFPSTVTDAAWSPDGTRLVYVDGDGNIATARPDGSGVLVLTQTKAGVKRAQPAFEDGGGEIVFSERGANGVWRLMSVSANGRDIAADGTPGEALMDSIGDGVGDTAADAVYDASRVSFDGPFNILAYQHAGSAGPEIWVLDRNQRGPSGRKARDGAAPTLSPDGSKIAFVGGDGQLYTESLPIKASSTAVKITVGIVGATHPVWSPDGTRIAFGTASDVESVSASAPAGGGGAPVKVESHSPGVPAYEPMTPTTVLRFSGDPVADSITQSRAFYTTVSATGTPHIPDGHAYAGDVTLVSTTDPAALTIARLAVPRGPILFTEPGSLSQDTLAEIARALGPQPKTAGSGNQATVNIIGDTKAVSASIETQLKGLGYQTKRTADSNPIGEAAALTGLTLGHGYGGSVYVVSATDTPAILSLEALHTGNQILLTDNATMPAADQPIIDQLAFTGEHPVTIFAVGGQAQAALDSSWPGKPADLRMTKVGGTDARLNALLVAKQFSDGPTEVALSATGSWQDALLAAANGPGMPLLFADPELGLSASASDWLGQSAASVSTVVVYGDTDSVPDAVVQQVVGALNAPAGTNSVLNPGRLLPL
jgi:hypothetical protein